MGLDQAIQRRQTIRIARMAVQPQAGIIGPHVADIRQSAGLETRLDRQETRLGQNVRIWGIHGCSLRRGHRTASD